MVNKYEVGGAVVGLFLPIIVDIVGGGAVYGLAKSKNTKSFGKAMLIMGGVGVALVAVSVAAGITPLSQVTVYKAVLY